MVGVQSLRKLELLENRVHRRRLRDGCRSGENWHVLLLAPVVEVVVVVVVGRQGRVSNLKEQVHEAALRRRDALSLLRHGLVRLGPLRRETRARVNLEQKKYLS